MFKMTKSWIKVKAVLFFFNNHSYLTLPHSVVRTNFPAFFLCLNHPICPILFTANELAFLVFSVTFVTLIVFSLNNMSMNDSICS